ncbi:MAG: hypothetical protein AAF990_04655 [Bacteroidota bacterium]
MKAEELRKLSEEELLKKKKGLQTVNGVMIGILIAFLFLIGKDLFSGNELETTTIVMPIILLATFPFNYQELSKIKAELARRESA